MKPIQSRFSRLAPTPSPLAASVRRSCRTGNASGFTLPEMVLTMAAVALLSAGVYALYAYGSAANSGVNTEQVNVQAISERAAAVYGITGSYADLTLEQAITDGVFPDGMVSYETGPRDGGIVDDGGGTIEVPIGTPGKSFDSEIVKGGGPHLPPTVTVPRVRSAWGQDVSLTPTQVSVPNDALSIDYANVPAAACPALARGASNGLWDVQVDGSSVVVVGTGGGRNASPTRTLNPELLASYCSSGKGPNGAVQMSFIRFDGLPGSSATAATLTPPGPAPAPPAAAPMALNLQPAAPPVTAGTVGTLPVVAQPPASTSVAAVSTANAPCVLPSPSTAFKTLECKGKNMAGTQTLQSNAYCPQSTGYPAWGTWSVVIDNCYTVM